jgi:hypothetical protein
MGETYQDQSHMQNWQCVNTSSKNNNALPPFFSPFFLQESLPAYQSLASSVVNFDVLTLVFTSIQGGGG